MKSEAMLWAGIIISPVVWFLSLEASFALAPLACSDKGKLFLHAVSGSALVLVVLAGCVSLAQWQPAGRNTADAAIPVSPRRRAMAVAGLGLSVLVILLIIAQAIPNLVLAGCE